MKRSHKWLRNNKFRRLEGEQRARAARENAVKDAVGRLTPFTVRDIITITASLANTGLQPGQTVYVQTLDPNFPGGQKIIVTASAANFTLK